MCFRTPPPRVGPGFLGALSRPCQRGRSGPLPVGRPCSTPSRSRIPTRPPVSKTSGGSPGRTFAPTGAVAVSFECYGAGAHAGAAKARPGSRPTLHLPYSRPARRPWTPRPIPFTYPTADRQTALDPEVNPIHPTLQPAYPIVGSPALQSAYPTARLPYTYPVPGRPGRTAPESRDLPYTYPTDTRVGTQLGRTRPCPPTYPTPTLESARPADSRPTLQPAYPIAYP